MQCYVYISQCQVEGFTYLSRGYISHFVHMSYICRHNIVDLIFSVFICENIVLQEHISSLVYSYVCICGCPLARALGPRRRGCEGQGAKQKRQRQARARETVVVHTTTVSLVALGLTHSRHRTPISTWTHSLTPQDS